MSNPNDDKKTYIRVFLRDKNNNPIICSRNDGHETTIDDRGYEDLLLKEDYAKVNLYATMEYIDLYNGKTYKVINKSFMPCVPVCLYITLEELQRENL